MRILFCNIAYMKYYKGIRPGTDEPINGGSYVKENHDAHEKNNFRTEMIEGQNMILGYYSTKSTNGLESNQMHIEKIEGINKDADVAENVLVVWCAKQADYDNRTVIVGWYKNASVYREYCSTTCSRKKGKTEERWFNIAANPGDCVLLPDQERNKFSLWNVPRKRAGGAAYGFGSANVWYASEDKGQEYAKKIIRNIEEYDGENWAKGSIGKLLEQQKSIRVRLEER